MRQMRKKQASPETDARLARLTKRFGAGNNQKFDPKTGREKLPEHTWKNILRLLTYFRGKGLKIALMLITMSFDVLSMVVGGYLFRPIINNLIAEGYTIAQRTELLIQGLAVLGAVYMVGVICNYIQQDLMVHIAQSALYDIRKELFAKLQRLNIGYYDAHNTGDLMSRFTNDVDNIANMFTDTAMSFFSGAIMIVGMLVMMIYTNIWLTLVVLAFLPIFVFGGAAIAKRSRRYFRAQQASLGTINGYMEEMVSGQKVVKVFGREEQAKEDFAVLNEDLKKKQLYANFFGGIIWPLMGNVSQICYAAVACVGGILCLTQGFDVGGLSVFVGYARQFARPINDISMQVSTVFSALAGAERVFKVLDEPEEIRSGSCCLPEPAAGVVVFDHVIFGYEQDQTILKDISLRAEPGQKIAFVGSTGAGKTTVTNLINRFYHIWDGKITVDGINIHDLETDSLRRNIAMVLQDTHLFTATVKENIRYGRLDATDEEVYAAARTACADSFIQKLPEGYDTIIKGDGSNLSQGQRQLLNIARAAVSKAPILILDEATSSVDTRTERHIEQGMDALMESRTTFVIAHRLSTVRNADQILVLEHGEIIERGNHEALMQKHGRYYELYTGRRLLE